MSSPGVTLTATLQDTSGTNNAGASLRITLCGFGQSNPRVIGTTMLARIQQKIVFPSGAGSISLWGNYQIDPPSTFYEIAIIDGKGNVVQAGMYQFTAAGTYDLSTIGQIFPGGTPYIPPGGIAVLTNPEGGAPQTIQGPIVVQGNFVYTGTLNANPTLYVVPINGGTPVFDGAQGIGQSLTLTANVTASTAQNFLSGILLPILIKQDATGGRTMTWPANWKNMPAINAAPKGTTSLVLMQDETGAFYPLGPAVFAVHP